VENIKHDSLDFSNPVDLAPARLLPFFAFVKLPGESKLRVN
jgi:hypothetical protein